MISPDHGFCVPSDGELIAEIGPLHSTVEIIVLFEMELLAEGADVRTPEHVAVPFVQECEQQRLCFNNGFYWD